MTLSVTVVGGMVIPAMDISWVGEERPCARSCTLVVYGEKQTGITDTPFKRRGRGSNVWEANNVPFGPEATKLFKPMYRAKSVRVLYHGDGVTNEYGLSDTELLHVQESLDFYYLQCE
jgi:hypothetical protein